MKIFNLPDDIFADKAVLKSEIIFHHYSAKTHSLKERSLLHRNAISLVLKGQKTMHFAEKTIQTSDTEIHFLSAGNCIASIDISKQQEFQSILIFFDDKVITEFLIKNNAFIENALRKSKPVPDPYISFKKDEFIINYITSLQIMLNSKKKLSPQMKALKVEEFFLYLLENHTTTFLSFRVSNKATPTEFSIRKVVETNITTNLTVDELAFLCNLSTSTFKRHFYKIYATSPNNWLLEQKMKIAARLLKEHKERPGEICYKLGFDTHTSFTKSFKKHYGVSPKDYAKGLTVQEHFLNR